MVVTTQSVPMWLVALCMGVVLLAGMLGLVLLVWAWRGRRVDDHPLCRKCGFDLTGLPKGSTQCSECGADLRHARSTRIGHRQRRTGWAVTGGVMILVSLLISGGGGYVVLSSIDLTPYKPNFWLVSDLQSALPLTRQAAARELISRAGNPDSNPTTYSAIADRLLALQADTSRTWFPEIGNYLDFMIESDRLSEEQMRRYASHAPNLTTELRPTLRRGEKLAYRIHSNIGRVGGSNPFTGLYRVELFVNGEPVEITSQSGLASRFTMAGSLGGIIQTAQDPFKNLPDGDVEIKLRVLTNVLKSFPGGFPGGEEPLPSTLASLVHESRHTVKLIPAGSSELTPVRREGLESQLRAAFTRYRVNMMQGSPAFEFVTTYLPENMAHEVVVVIPGKEIVLGTITFAKETATHHVVMGSSKDQLPERVTVLLRPSAEVARRTPNVTRYADVEVRFDNVPVIPETPTTGP